MQKLHCNHTAKKNIRINHYCRPRLKHNGIMRLTPHRRAREIVSQLSTPVRSDACCLVDCPCGCKRSHRRLSQLSILELRHSVVTASIEASGRFVSCDGPLRKTPSVYAAMGHHGAVSVIQFPCLLDPAASLPGRESFVDASAEPLHACARRGLQAQVEAQLLL